MLATNKRKHIDSSARVCIVSKQFTDRWKHDTRVPTVVKVHVHCFLDLMIADRVVQIWKIYGDKVVGDRFSRYRRVLFTIVRAPGIAVSLHAANREMIQRKSEDNDDNLRRRFHGTIRACQIGDRDNCTEFCTDADCSLCRIIEVRDVRCNEFEGSLITSIISPLSNSVEPDLVSISVVLGLAFIHLRLRPR